MLRASRRSSVRPRPWIPPADRPARILLVRLSALGDVLHALPVLSGLREHLPDAHLAWAVEDRAKGLLMGRSDLDAIHVFPRRALSAAKLRPFALATALAPFAREMRRTPFDLVLDLQGNLKSGAVSRLARADVRFGTALRDTREANSVFVRRRAGATPHRHRVERNLALASHAIGAPLPYVPPGFPRSTEAKGQADVLLEGAGLDGRFVVLHPGTSNFGAFKRWPTDRFAALGRRLAADGATVVITGSANEASMARAILQAMDGAGVFLATPSLPVLAEVIDRAAFFVAADTGPLHLAALVDTPLLGLYGPKDTSIYGPYGMTGDGVAGTLPVLTQDDVACRPCRLRRCAAPLCMTTMTVEDVYEAVRARLPLS